jgi:prepilin-type N-terminal cleavage/methylation domain-containing protein/prepilin-type processing-associated H-X9-DG protein
MSPLLPYRRSSGGFTLIELLVVVAIIGLLASLSMPAFQQARLRARSMQCGSNLRQIGVAVLSAAQDNDNKYPKINDPLGNYYPDDSTVKNLADSLQPYGITGTVLRCPADVLASNYYKQYGCSYMWCPMSDDETTNLISLYRGQNIFQVSSARVRIVTDYDTVHFNRYNTLYADGHVTVRYK